MLHRTVEAPLRANGRSLWPHGTQVHPPPTPESVTSGIRDRHWMPDSRKRTAHVSVHFVYGAAIIGGRGEPATPRALSTFGF